MRVAGLGQVEAQRALDKPADHVLGYVELFGRLRSIALGPVESRNLVLELARQFAAASRRKD